uniref:Uncharacterized protein n=1 Tax=Pelodiscus sinensis TaxID=13735 RepID=K7F231_PELSI
GRSCHKLRGSIIHFGEKGTLAATEMASKADVILCLGSSKILRKYPHLWCRSKLPGHCPELYMVNLQGSPKHDLAALKRHGECGDVIRLLLEELGLESPSYDRTKGPYLLWVFPLAPMKVVAPPWSLEEMQMREQHPLLRPYSSLGGWFGRGYAKGSKRKQSK